MTVDKVRMQYDWDFEEREAKDVVRFDWDNGKQSIWLYEDVNGEIDQFDGTVPVNVEISVVSETEPH